MSDLCSYFPTASGSASAPTLSQSLSHGLSSVPWGQALCSHGPAPAQCSPSSFQRLSHLWLHIFLQGCTKAQLLPGAIPSPAPLPAPPGCLGTCSPGDTGWSPTAAGAAPGPAGSFPLGGISC